MADAVVSVMECQYGLVTTQQALNAGMSRRQIRYRLNSGAWQEVEPNVYRLAGILTSWHCELLAACLSSGGVASHRCAAALWKLEGYWTPTIEVSVPRGRWYRSKSHRVHESTQWDRRDELRVDGIPCTGIARTLLDLCAVVSIRRAELLAESALRQSLLDWPNLRATLIRHSRRGRDGCGKLRSLLEMRYGDDELPLSGWSRLISNLVIDAGLPEPRLEYPLHDRRGKLITVFDLAWPRHHVALELDSVRYHLNRKSFEKDKRKRNTARLLGWSIHEITWEMSSSDPRGITNLIRSALTGSEIA